MPKYIYIIVNSIMWKILVLMPWLVKI